VPLVGELHPIVDRLAEGRSRGDLLFRSPNGQPLREGNWRRSIGWTKLIDRLDLAPFRVHDLRHTAASMWNVKVVQRIFGHKSATMTLDLYGHLWDTSL
jgi:integrase